MCIIEQSDIFTAAERLPAAPQRLAEFFRLLEDPRTDVDEIAEVVEGDAALAAGVIRISNSAYYGLGGIGSVPEAVQRVGFGELQRLVTWAWAGGVSDHTLVHFNIQSDALCEHMICTALAAEALGVAAGVNPCRAYTAGLLRLIGMMVLDRLTQGPSFDPVRDENYEAWETRHLQRHHYAVTADILEKWNFAPEVVEAIRGHTLQAMTPEPTREAVLLNLAGWVVQELGCGLAGERALWDLTPEKLARAGLEEEQVTSQVNKVLSTLGRMHSALLAA